jgi:hypothetical protein
MEPDLKFEFTPNGISITTNFDRVFVPYESIENFRYSTELINDGLFIFSRTKIKFLFRIELKNSKYINFVEYLKNMTYNKEEIKELDKKYKKLYDDLLTNYNLYNGSE